MRKLTHHDTLRLQDVVNIGGDLLLLPFARAPNLSESLALQKAGIISIDSSIVARNQLTLQSLQLEHEYTQARQHTGQEPDWVQRLPLHSRTFIRYNYALMHEDALAIMGPIPYAGVSYMYTEGGLTDDVERLFGLRRLQGVKQLGFLQAPWVAMHDLHYVTPISSNTRLAHSYDVATLVSLMCHNLGLSKSVCATGRVAGLTHDWLTPAGGDSVKLVDPSNFDEDSNYRREFERKIDGDDWRAIRATHSVDRELLFSAILNHGVLGEILDLADKIAYVARDIRTCLDLMALPKDEDAYVGIRLLRETVDEFPYVCGVWDAIRMHRGHLVFTDAARLIAFLKARIILFRELYYHPRARFGEYLISRILVKRLYDAGSITREELLEMRDHDLEARLGDVYGSDKVQSVLSLRSNVRSFPNHEEALKFKRELDRSGNNFSLIEDHLRAIKPGTHLIVDSADGPTPLIEAYEGDARELHEMANMLPGVHVYYIGEESGHPDSEVKDLFSILAAAR